MRTHWGRQKRRWGNGTSHNLFNRSRENHENSKSVRSVTWARLELCTTLMWRKCSIPYCDWCVCPVTEHQVRIEKWQQKQQEDYDQHNLQKTATTQCDIFTVTPVHYYITLCIAPSWFKTLWEFGLVFVLFNNTVNSLKYTVSDD